MDVILIVLIQHLLHLHQTLAYTLVVSWLCLQLLVQVREVLEQYLLVVPLLHPLDLLWLVLVPPLSQLLTLLLYLLY
jgi:hypothetical protein